MGTQFNTPPALNTPGTQYAADVNSLLTAITGAINALEAGTPLNTVFAALNHTHAYVPTSHTDNSGIKHTTERISSQLGGESHPNLELLLALMVGTTQLTGLKSLDDLTKHIAGTSNKHMASKIDYDENNTVEEMIALLQQGMLGQYSVHRQVGFEFTPTAATKSVSEADLLALHPEMDAGPEHINPNCIVQLYKIDDTSGKRTPSGVAEPVEMSTPVDGGSITHIKQVDCSSLTAGKNYVLVVGFRKASVTPSGGSQT